jgi:hypothetical protein
MRRLLDFDASAPTALVDCSIMTLTSFCWCDSMRRVCAGGQPVGIGENPYVLTGARRDF